MRLHEAARWKLTQNCFRQLTKSIQLFRESLSEKVHATIPKGIVVGGFEFTVLSRNFERMARERPWTYVCEC